MSEAIGDVFILMVFLAFYVAALAKSQRIADGCRYFAYRRQA